MVDFRRTVDRILSSSLRVFGESIKFFPKSGGVLNIRGIFDNDFQVLDPDTEQMISSNQPGLGVNLNDFEVDPRVEDQCEIRGIKYRVTEVREDGQGGATLLLNKAKTSDRVEHPRAR